jgi:hypothetical protein
VGPPMTVEYRDVFLRHIGAAPAGSAARGSVTYRSGTLLEREHAPTFQNLEAQTARVTAPPTTSPVAGRTDLEVTGRLATVRHDLASLSLYGGSRPYAADERESDLVVMSGDLTVRVPGAGHLLAGQPLDRDSRLELRWDPGARAYEVVALAPVDASSEGR